MFVDLQYLDLQGCGFTASHTPKLAAEKNLGQREDFYLSSIYLLLVSLLGI